MVVLCNPTSLPSNIEYFNVIICITFGLAANIAAHFAVSIDEPPPTAMKESYGLRRAVFIASYCL
jgi:hypothetical protein